MTDNEQKRNNQRQQADQNMILGMGLISMGLFVLFIIIILKD